MSAPITLLPLKYDFHTLSITKHLVLAHKALANLRGISKIIPNQNILINSLSLQEAKDSSEIENIVTTHDELYRSMADASYFSKEIKEVQNYKSALLKGFSLVTDNKLLLTRYILEIQEVLEGNTA